MFGKSAKVRGSEKVTDRKRTKTTQNLVDQMFPFNFLENEHYINIYIYRHFY